jgi:hypothetical protein
MWKSSLRRAAFAAVVGIGCSTSGGGGGGSGGTTGASWLLGDCDAMGAETMPNGACYVPCTTSSDCPGGATCVIQQYQAYCRIGSCEVASDCGPQGWDCQGNDLCMMTCTTVTSGSSDECPPGHQCHQILSTDLPACHKLPGSSCGEPCPQGCCSTGGNICCKPPLCAGDCAYSPCCY